jgi:hypothetical protein
MRIKSFKISSGNGVAPYYVATSATKRISKHSQKTQIRQREGSDLRHAGLSAGVVARAARANERDKVEHLPLREPAARGRTTTESLRTYLKSPVSDRQSLAESSRPNSLERMTACDPSWTDW